MGKNVKQNRWQSCNLMQLEGETPRLWQVAISGAKTALVREQPLEGAEAVQPRLVGKDWNELVRPRLNVAVLPPESVFVRVVSLPQSDPQETHSMLEFQLEKLSPLPVAQIMWTYEVVPARGLSESQSLLVVIVSRTVVEELLGKFESRGFLADRVEFPFLDQLLNLEVSGDGVWLFPEVRSSGAAMWAAWWYGGILRNVALLNLPQGAGRAEVLKAQLSQMQWAGELEGWVTSSPRYTLVAEGEVAEGWRAELQPVLGAGMTVAAPVPQGRLAVLTAKRATQNPSLAALLPPESATQYRQTFVDRIWMQGVFGVLLLYLLGVFLYLGIVGFKNYQLDTVQQDERNMALAYTNAIQLREQVSVLQERVNLQFAALNSYLAVATNLPPELTLDSMNFDRGTRLTLGGTGGPDTRTRVNEFVAALKGAQFNNQPLFKNIEGLKTFNKPGGQQISWSFQCELRKVEAD